METRLFSTDQTYRLPDIFEPEEESFPFRFQANFIVIVREKIIMTGQFNAMSRNTAFLFLCTLVITSIKSDATDGFPYYNGGSHSITNDHTTTDALWVGDTAANTLLQIQTNAVVEAGTLNMNGNDNVITNRLVLEDSSQLIIGTTTFTTTNSASLIVGSNIDEGIASVSMDNAAHVEAENFYMGAGSNDSGSVVLSGEGVVLAISNAVHIGVAGSDNTIDISGGATFKIGGALNLGSATTSNNVISATSGGTLFVDSVTNINVIGFESQANQIVIGNEGTLEVGGDLNTEDLKDRGLVLNQNADVTVNGELSANNSAIENIEGVGLNIVLNTSNALWNVTDAAGASVGFSTSGNSLTLTNGANVSIATTLRIGRDATANNNTLNVLDGALLSVSGTNFIGFSGSENSLTVNAATFNADTVILGRNVSANGNQLFLETNANVAIANRLVVGQSSTENQYLQSGGTNTVSGAFIIGQTEDATGQTGFVDSDSVETTGNLAIIGTNSTLNIQQDLIVGLEGGGSILAIRDGGMVNVDGDAIIGEAVGDNYIYLQRDADTRFNVASNLVVGKEGGSNRFAVYGGTANISGDLFLGSTTNQHEEANFIHIETTNAILNVAGVIYIGASNSINTLDIVAGGTVGVQDLFVGTYDGVSNNVVTITGEGSLLSITNNLAIGSDTGTNNTVAVENGGTLFVGGTISEVGGSNNVLNINNNGTLQTLDWDFATISSNIFLDTGAALEVGGVLSGTNRVEGGIEIAINGSIATNDALWNTGADILYAGNETDGNILTAKEGGIATTSTNLIVGNSSASIDNTLSSTGLSSRIIIGNNLIVGNTGSSGNTLNILGGGEITVSNNFFMGSTSDSNTGLLEGFTGTNSVLNVMGDLTLGLNGSLNTLQISSNAVINIDGLATIGLASDNNTLVLTGSNAVLNVTSNLIIGVNEATGNTLIIEEGEANLDYDLIIGSLTNSSENSVAVSNSNSTLNVGNNLIVGDVGNSNTLTIINGATVNISSNVWIGLASSDNTIEVRGTNAMLTVGNDLYVGSTNDTSSGNRLGAYDMGNILIGGNLSLAKGVVEINYDAQIKVDGDYEQDEFSTLLVRLSTNSVTTNLVVDGTARFDRDTTIIVTSDETIPELVENGVTNEIERTIVAAGTLTIDDQDATTDLLHSSINFQINALLGFDFIVTNNTIFLNNFIERSIREAAGLDGMLADVADEIQSMAVASNEFAQAMRETFQNGMTGQEINQAMNDYYGEKTSSAPMHNVINQGIGSIASELTVRGDNTRSRISTAAEAPTPVGAGGPHMQDQQLQGWVAGYGSWGDKSADDGFDAYDSNLGGFIIGADLSISQNILVGLAGGSNSGSVDKDNGARGDTKTTYGAIYVSLGTKDWFLDASMLYGSSSIDNTLGDVFDTTASYDAQNLAFYLGGGKEIVGKYLIITPQASLLANYYEQDAYDEESTNAVPRSVNSFDALYIQSSLGCNLAIYMAMGEVTLKPELRVHWLHEFNAKEEDLDYTLIGGTGGSYNLILQSPEEDVLRLGAGVSAKLSEFLELRADLDTQQARAYSDYTVSGSLRYQF